MDIDGIRQALHRQPFQRFTMRLGDGRALPVPHPDFVAVAPQRIIVVAEDNSWSVIEPFLVVSLDYESARSGPPAG
jgi:hypothetical protein